MAGFVGTREQVAYQQGVDDAAAVLGGGQPTYSAAASPFPFFYTLGFGHRRGGFKLIPWDLVTATALTDQQQNYYLEGYGRGLDIAKGIKPAPASPGGGKERYDWLSAGTADASEGYPARYVLTTEPRGPVKDYGPKRGSDAIIVQPPPDSAPIPYQGPPIYEVAATFLTKLVPLDRLLTVAKFSDLTIRNPLYRQLFDAALEFQILGDAPGESKQGYGLSGRDGPVAKYLAWLDANGSPAGKPQDYGLSAWWVTRTAGRRGGRGGIRFLSKSELLQLGINPEEF